VAGVCGGARVGIRLSPVSPVNGADLDSDPAGTYGYVVERLNAFSLAYIHIIQGATQGPREVPGGFDLQSLRRSFKGLYVANNGNPSGTRWFREPRCRSGRPSSPPWDRRDGFYPELPDPPAGQRDSTPVAQSKETRAYSSLAFGDDVVKPAQVR
jgi:hypothetical protein